MPIESYPNLHDITVSMMRLSSNKVENIFKGDNGTVDIESGNKKRLANHIEEIQIPSPVSSVIIFSFIDISRCVSFNDLLR